MAQGTIDNEFGAGQSPDPNEHRHVYRAEDGSEQSLIADTHHVPVEAAADRLDIDAEQWEWIFTEGHALGGGHASAALPCTTCAEPVWTTRQSAVEIRQGQGFVRCGPCVREREDDD